MVGNASMSSSEYMDVILLSLDRIIATLMAVHSGQSKSSSAQPRQQVSGQNEGAKQTRRLLNASKNGRRGR